MIEKWPPLIRTRPAAWRWTIAAVVLAAALAFAGTLAWRDYRTPLAAAPANPAAAATDIDLKEPPPLLFEPLTEAQALTANAALPFSTMPNPPAAPFILSREDAVAYTTALDCMAVAIYYEAGFESAVGREAVAQVILNRVRHPLYPKSVCGVVFQGSERTTGCQFSFTCDGALTRVPNPGLLAEARAIAEKALAGAVEPTVGWSTHYHAQYVFPYWGPKLAKTAMIGAHIFYRFPAPLGLARWFTGRYDGVEPVIALMAGFSTIPPPIEVPPLDPALGGTAAPYQLPVTEPIEPRFERAPLDRALAERAAPGATPTPAAAGAATPSPDPYFPQVRRRTRSRLPM